MQNRQTQLQQVLKESRILKWGFILFWILCLLSCHTKRVVTEDLDLKELSGSMTSWDINETIFSLTPFGKINYLNIDSPSALIPVAVRHTVGNKSTESNKAVNISSKQEEDATHSNNNNVCFPFYTIPIIIIVVILLLAFLLTMKIKITYKV